MPRLPHRAPRPAAGDSEAAQQHLQQAQQQHGGNDGGSGDRTEVGGSLTAALPRLVAAQLQVAQVGATGFVFGAWQSVNVC